MFSIKFIEPSGHEQIFEAEQVWANPAVEPGAHLVFVTPPNPPAEPKCFGSIGARLFVMNDKGKTIARYNLGT